MQSMIRRIYNIFIAPKQLNEDVRNREVVLNALLAASLLGLGLALLLSLFSVFVLHHEYARVGLITIGVALICVVGLYGLSRRGGRFRLAAALLVAIYSLIAANLIYRSGITIPSGELLFGLVIVLAGILLGSSYSLYAATGAGIWVISIQEATRQGAIHPDLSWINVQPSLGDAAGFCLLFAIIALVSWLFNRQMEQSLFRAQRAEKALMHQKEILESTVEERTRELQDAQLERMQQLYRFAELGQLSTALMHELANHLTTLTLDIEGLEGQTRSRMLSRAKRSIRYIDTMVLRVCDQLQGRSNVKAFSIATELDEVVQILNHRAQEAHVRLRWQALGDRKALRCYGEPFKLRQLLANLISNGIDSYEGSLEEKREVLVTAQVIDTDVELKVHDWGKGIPAEKRAQLFEPLYSTKKTGMGMGLFIAKQIVEEHFKGVIAVDDTEDHTVFMVRLKKV